MRELFFLRSVPCQCLLARFRLWPFFGSTLSVHVNKNRYGEHGRSVSPYICSTAYAATAIHLNYIKIRRWQRCRISDLTMNPHSMAEWLRAAERCFLFVSIRRSIGHKMAFKLMSFDINVTHFRATQGSYWHIYLHQGTDQTIRRYGETNNRPYFMVCFECLRWPIWSILRMWLSRFHVLRHPLLRRFAGFLKASEKRQIACTPKQKGKNDSNLS